MSSVLNIPQAQSFHHEYNSMACTIETVDDVHEAIDHIHQHGRYLDTSKFEILGGKPARSKEI